MKDKLLLKKDLKVYIFFGLSALFTLLFIIPVMFRLSGFENQFRLFFRDGRDFMADLYNVCFYSEGFDPYHLTENGLLEKAYFPISYVFCGILSRFMLFNGYNGSVRSLGTFEILGGVIFMSFMMAALAVCIYAGIKGKVSRKVIAVILLLSTGPCIYTIERGNLIFFSVIGSMIFLLTYRSEDRKLREFGYIMLAVAAAFKGFPAMLGILLVYEKRWKEALRLVIYGILFAFVPFLFLKGGFSSIPQWLSNMKENTDYYILRGGDTAGYKFFILNITKRSTGEYLKVIKASRAVIYAAAVLSMCGAYFIKKEWIRVLLIVTLMMMIPDNNAYYSLMYAIPAAVVLLNDEDNGIWITVSLALLAVVLMLWRIPSPKIYYKAQNSVFMSNTALLLLFGGVCAYSIYSGITGIISMSSKKKGKVKVS